MAALTPEQVSIIKSTVPVLRQHGVAITAHFYKTIIDEVPALNNIFNHANQVNNHQAAALATALYAYAANIDDLGVLSPALEKICHKHASLYIQPEHYKLVGEYLLRAMGDVLGAVLTPEILEAWGVAYWQLANLMIKLEADMYEEADGWTDWRDFKISEKVQESDEITSFYLRPIDGKALPKFLPGQYISIKTDVPQLQYQQPRQYSLSDAPNPNYYRISVKKETGIDTENADDVAHPGYISNILHEEKAVGDILKVSHPFGEFFLEAKQIDESPIVLLSAGVGVTPMVSMLNTLTERRSNQPVSFVHGARTGATRAFHSHVQHLAKWHPNIRHTSFIKNPNENITEGHDYHIQGRLDLHKLDHKNDLFLHDNRTQYFVCGPESFMADVENGLLDRAVDPTRIHLEIFGVGAIVQD